MARKVLTFAFLFVFGISLMAGGAHVCLCSRVVVEADQGGCCADGADCCSEEGGCGDSDACLVEFERPSAQQPELARAPSPVLVPLVMIEGEAAGFLVSGSDGGSGVWSVRPPPPSGQSAARPFVWSVETLKQRR